MVDTCRVYIAYLSMYYVCLSVCPSPVAVDLVRMTVCMTRLLVKEKLKQFSDLCFRAEVCAVGVGKGRV